jgi:flagellin-like hook-associated protein FlgL
MVDTREKASAFLDNVHQAIKYLLYSNTTLGAQSNRLNYTSANLVNTVENTQASESTIRDADMAKEMTSYVKSNVLAQSAQAMLAQANQNSSSVLSLLQ